MEDLGFGGTEISNTSLNLTNQIKIGVELIKAIRETREIDEKYNTKDDGVLT